MNQLYLIGFQRNVWRRYSIHLQSKQATYVASNQATGLAFITELVENVSVAGTPSTSEAVSFHEMAVDLTSHVESKEFWRRCMTHRITGFMDFVHSSEFYISRKQPIGFIYSPLELCVLDILVFVASIFTYICIIVQLLCMLHHNFYCIIFCYLSFI
jgi:hypothetical protein